MHVWKISSDDNTDTEIRILKDGEGITWRFDDWRIEREVTIHVRKTHDKIDL